MSEKAKSLRSEKGQSLVIVAAVMVGLLALAGLAIDGGNLFFQRRNTQNAADASAMAGTRVLAEAICLDPDATDAAVLEAVHQLAQENGVEDLSGLQAFYVNIEETVLGEVGSGDIPVGASGVMVTILRNIDTFFMRVVTIETVDVTASATAMTGPVTVAGGIRPVGVPLPIEAAINPGDGFTISFGNCNQPDQCIVSYTGGQVQHRGYMNLAYVWNTRADLDEEAQGWPRAIDRSADANVIRGWMTSGFPGGTTFYADCEGCMQGDFVHAKPGTNSTVIGAAGDLAGSTIIVPIFDQVYAYDEIPAPKPPGASQGGDFYYHVVGFMGFTITGANQGGGTISGYFDDAIVGAGQVGGNAGSGFSQSGACETHLQAVNLWR